MSKKIILALTMILCLALLLSACGGNTAKSNTSSAGASPSSNYSTSPKIVFHSTITDPQIEYLNTLGGSKSTGTADLDLILYQVKPNVFEGFGIMTRTWNMSNELFKSKQEYIYRTGLIYTEAGQEGRTTLTGGLSEDRDIETFMGEDAPFNLSNHKEGTLMQKDLPFLLKLEGEKASFSIKIHEQANLVFEGKFITDATEVPASGLQKSENDLIYINSLWSGSFSGGNGDYTAILFAAPGMDKNSYSGRLSINGNGAALSGLDEKVTFSLKPFDNALYQKSGGKLLDRFTHLGVLQVAGGDYILLLDGEQVILEPVGKGILFYGKLRSDTEAAFLQNEAQKTREMTSYLCRQKSNTGVDYSAFQGLDPNKPEDMKKLQELSRKFTEKVSSENGTPAWYPDGLIPKVNFSADDGYLTTPTIDAQFFKLFNTQYYENEDFTDLISPYRAALSGRDGYKEHLDYENGEGVFVFTMGRYSLQVFLQQSSRKLSSVTVQIY